MHNVCLSLYFSLQPLDRDPPSGKSTWKIRVKVHDGQFDWSSLRNRHNKSPQLRHLHRSSAPSSSLSGDNNNSRDLYSKRRKSRHSNYSFVVPRQGTSSSSSSGVNSLSSDTVSSLSKADWSNVDLNEVGLVRKISMRHVGVAAEGGQKSKETSISVPSTLNHPVICTCNEVYFIYDKSHVLTPLCPLIFEKYATILQTTKQTEKSSSCQLRKINLMEQENIPILVCDRNAIKNLRKQFHQIFETQVCVPPKQQKSASRSPFYHRNDAFLHPYHQAKEGKKTEKNDKLENEDKFVDLKKQRRIKRSMSSFSSTASYHQLKPQNEAQLPLQRITSEKHFEETKYLRHETKLKNKIGKISSTNQLFKTFQMNKNVSNDLTFKEEETSIKSNLKLRNGNHFDSSAILRNRKKRTTIMNEEGNNKRKRLKLENQFVRRRSGINAAISNSFQVDSGGCLIVPPELNSSIHSVQQAQMSHLTSEVMRGQSFRKRTKVHVVETIVTIIVKDINDNSPIFPNATIYGEVQENGPIGKFIINYLL